MLCQRLSGSAAQRPADRGEGDGDAHQSVPGQGVATGEAIDDPGQTRMAGVNTMLLSTNWAIGISSVRSCEAGLAPAQTLQRLFSLECLPAQEPGQPIRSPHRLQTIQ